MVTVFDKLLLSLPQGNQTEYESKQTSEFIMYINLINKIINNYQIETRDKKLLKKLTAYIKQAQPTSETVLDTDQVSAPVNPTMIISSFYHQLPRFEKMQLYFLLKSIITRFLQNLRTPKPSTETSP